LGYKVISGAGDQRLEATAPGRDAAYILACAWHCEGRSEVRVETPSGVVWPYPQFKLMMRGALIEDAS
jgi:hypothetical protein